MPKSITWRTTVTETKYPLLFIWPCHTDHTLTTIVNHTQGIASIVSNPDQLSPKLHSAHTQSKMLKNNFAGWKDGLDDLPNSLWRFGVQGWCLGTVLTWKTECPDTAMLYLAVAILRMWTTDAETSSAPEAKMTKMGKEANRRWAVSLWQSQDLPSNLVAVPLPTLPFLANLTAEMKLLVRKAVQACTMCCN